MYQMKSKNKEPDHWPTLNTVMMVEATLKNMKNSVMTIPELKREIPRKVNHNTLMVILEYLENSGKILVGLKGITWVHTDTNTLRSLIKKGIEV